MCERLDSLLRKKNLLTDVSKLSPHHQTSSIEAYHSVILQFAPKNIVYSYMGMLSRYKITEAIFFINYTYWYCCTAGMMAMALHYLMSPLLDTSQLVTLLVTQSTRHTVNSLQPFFGDELTFVFCLICELKCWPCGSHPCPTWTSDQLLNLKVSSV